MDMSRLPCFLTFLTANPKKGSSGSASHLSIVQPPETQHVPLILRPFLLYVVLFSCPVTGRSAPKEGGVVIPAPLYTSGKLLYARKSDRTGKVNR